MTTESMKTQIQQLDEVDWHSTMPNLFARSTSYLISLQELENYYNSSLYSSSAAMFVTSTTSAPLNSYTQDQLYYWPMLLLIFPLITVFGNVLVVLSVIRETNLHTATNYFIVSLAAADIGLALVVMPLASWVEANAGKWRYGTVLCDIFIMFDVMLCTASILNLAAISMDRYVAVTKPIFYAQHSNNMRVSLTIAFTWVLSFIIALPIACGLNNVPHRVLDVCIMYTPEYIIGSSIGSFYIPCPIMIILYYRVFRAIRKRTRRSKPTNLVKTSKSQSTILSDRLSEMNCAPTAMMHCDELTNSTPCIQTAKAIAETNPSSLDYEKQKPSLIYLNRTFDSGISSSRNRYNEELIDLPSIENIATRTYGSDNQNSNSKDHTPPTVIDDDTGAVEFKNMDDFRKHLRERIKRAKRSSLSILTPNISRLSSKNVYGLATLEPHGRSGSRSGNQFLYSIRLRDHSKMHNPNFNVISSLKCRTRKLLHGGSKSHSLKNARSKAPNICAHNGSANKIYSKENLAARREKKATKTLAIVLGVFLFCWMPFFTVNIANAFCFKSSSLRQTPICNMPDSVTTICVWLGYINSFLNPILYTIFNNEFRKAFKKLLHCN